MLLSLSHKFIFIANLKSASSAIEAAIGHAAEIRITGTNFGKHDGLSAISQKFPWVRRYVPYDEFFVFGVMRDPVDYLLSLYNSHHKEDFDGKYYSTKGMPFDEFLHVWCGRSWQAKPQHLRFNDQHGRFGTSCVIDLERLDEEFPRVCAHLGLGQINLERSNRSPAALRRSDLSPEQIGQIKAKYESDYEFMKRAPGIL